jgi:hypothetical protein
MKKILFLFSLGLVASLGLGWLCLSDSALVGAQSNPQPPHPLEAINQKAKIARTGNVADAEDYVREVIKVAGFENELQGFTLTAIKDRVGRAESRYRQGHAPGVPEAKIVRTVNGLVRKFSLPAYAKTYNHEVRRLRLGLLQNFPQVIAQKSQSTQPPSAGAAIDSQMSPAEAVFVLAMMLQQKLANPEFQLTYTEQVDRWAQAHNHSPQNNPHATDQDRGREIREALNRAAASASMSDALQLSNLTLNTLGIEQ